MSNNVKTLIVGILMFGGFVIVGLSSSPWTAVGVFLMIWSNNIKPNEL